MQKRKILIGSAVVGGLTIIGAVAGTGMVFAQNANNANPILTRAAQIIGVDDKKLTEAIKQASIEQIDTKLKAGSITQTQADKMKSDINAGKIVELNDETRVKRPQSFDNISKYLGITREELITDFKAGQKLSDITNSKGKNITDLKAYVTQNIKDTTLLEVKNGSITQSEADNIVNKQVTMLNNVINGQLPKFDKKM